jgi:hypothetical protein
LAHLFAQLFSVSLEQFTGNEWEMRVLFLLAGLLFLVLSDLVGLPDLVVIKPKLAFDAACAAHALLSVGVDSVLDSLEPISFTLKLSISKCLLCTFLCSNSI